MAQIEVTALNHKSPPTVDELVNTLKRSSIPNIVIEGTDDVFVYRWLKKKINKPLAGLLACGGRDKLFQIFDRRNEFPNTNVVFIADQDSYKFDGIPDNRKDIIFTSGYCIENDIST